MTRAQYLHCGMAAGMGKREVLRPTPGVGGALWELYLRDGRAGRQERDE